MQGITFPKSGINAGPLPNVLRKKTTASKMVARSGLSSLVGYHGDCSRREVVVAGVAFDPARDDGAGRIEAERLEAMSPVTRSAFVTRPRAVLTADIPSNRNRTSSKFAGLLPRLRGAIVVVLVA